MSYLTWFKEHSNKHKKIIIKLLQKDFSQEQIIEYFDFENMIKAEPNFCPLYTEHKKCHDIKSLNCYLCACPNFRFNDEGFETIDKKTKYSFCSIDSKNGKAGVYDDAIHQDCSACSVPHHKDYVAKHFNLSWKQIMNKCNPETT
jgi:hypothetical protein